MVLLLLQLLLLLLHHFHPVLANSFHCLGNCHTPFPPPSPHVQPGAALCGGHMYPGVTIPTDLEAYRWMINRSDGGNFVVLTADPEDTPCDLYNPFIYNMSSVNKQPRSVTTICFTNRSLSFHPRTAQILASASAVFFTGGDQYKYYTYFRDSPVSQLLIKVPLVGGSSAGLAVQGRLLFDAKHGGIDSTDALQYPTDSEVSVANDLFSLRWMEGVFSDTHFFQRDRMGRLLAFLGRSLHNGWGKQKQHTTEVLGCAVSEHSYLAIDGTSGEASFHGVGPIYLVRPNRQGMVVKEGQPLSLLNATVLRWNSSASDAATSRFSFDTWAVVAGFAPDSDPGHSVWYNLSVVRGALASTGAGGVYGYR